MASSFLPFWTRYLMSFSCWACSSSEPKPNAGSSSKRTPESTMTVELQKSHFWAGCPLYSRGAAHDGHLKLCGIIFLNYRRLTLQVLRLHYNVSFKEF